MRIVIKIGTSTITHPTGRLNIRQMEALCKVLSDLKNAGNEVILVSSARSAWAWASSASESGRQMYRPSRLPPQSVSVS